jgi:hypothetical protein
MVASLFAYLYTQYENCTSLSSSCMVRALLLDPSLEINPKVGYLYFPEVKLFPFYMSFLIVLLVVSKS